MQSFSEIITAVDKLGIGNGYDIVEEGQVFVVVFDAAFLGFGDSRHI